MDQDSRIKTIVETMANEELNEMVYKYATVPLYTEPFNVEVPQFIAKGMWIKEVTLKNSASVDGNCFVDVRQVQDAIFRQGHVSQLITMYAHLELVDRHNAREWRNKRKCLTKALMEFAKREIPCISHWEIDTWMEELLSGKVTVQSMATVMRPWLNLPENDAERKMLQYILPLFLFLGDYSAIPESKTVLKHLRYVIVGSISYLGANTWRGTFYDDSHSTKLFPSVVKDVDRLFVLDRKKSKINNVIVEFFVKPKSENRTLPRLLKQAGNWLSFGAYITLVSKYARYSLPNANGDMKIADALKQVQSKYYKELTNKLEQF